MCVGFGQVNLFSSSDVALDFGRLVVQSDVYSAVISGWECYFASDSSDNLLSQLWSGLLKGV